MVEFLFPSLIAVVALIVQRATWTMSMRLALVESVGVKRGGERVDCDSFEFSLPGCTGRAPRYGAACTLLRLRSYPNTIPLPILLQEERCW